MIYKSIIFFLLVLFLVSCHKEDILIDKSAQVESFNYSNGHQTGVHILGRVWEDIDGDGIMDAQEPGIGEAQVLFVNADRGWVIGKVITDDQGYYKMYASIPINYRLRVILPQEYQDDYVLSERNSFIAGIANSFKNENSKLVTDVYRTDEQRKLNCGIHKGGQIGDYVWLDSKDRSGYYNHIQDENDLPLANVNLRLNSIDLRTRKEKLFLETSSSSDGFYFFSNIPKGEYTIECDFPANPDYPHALLKPVLNKGDEQRNSDIATVNLQFGYGTTEFINLEASEVMDDIDFGFTNYCHVEPWRGPEVYVWLDENENGLKENEEPLIGGVEIEVVNQSLNQLENTFESWNRADYAAAFWKTTCYDYIKDQNYYYKIILDDKYRMTEPNVGMDDTKNSDFDNDGLSATFTLRSSNFGRGQELDYTFYAGLIRR